jgi:hypothetical protein
MAYPDPQFNVIAEEYLVGTPNNPITLGTTTASGANTFTGTAGSAAGNGVWLLPQFKQDTIVKNIRVRVGTAPAANVTSLTITWLNGTNTIGQTVIGTNTAGSEVDATMTALSTDSHGVATGGARLTAGTEPTVTVTATGTASGQALGTYSVDWVFGGLFTT